MRYMVSDRGFVRRSRRIGCWAVREFTPRNNLAAEFGHAMKKVTSVTGLLYEAISFRQIEKLHQNMYRQSLSEKVVICNPRHGAFGSFSLVRGIPLQQHSHSHVLKPRFV